MTEIIVDTGALGEDLDIGRHSIGQGGLSDRSTVAMHADELRNLNPKYIRLFVQEYYHVYPDHGVYDWRKLDEWNIGLRGNVMKHHRHPEYQPCFVIDVIKIMIDEGVSSSCYWQLRNLPVRKGLLDFLGEKELGIINAANHSHNLISVFDNQGVARPVYFAFKLLSRLVGKRATVEHSGGNAKSLASYDPELDAVNVLVWNFVTENCQREKVSLRIKVKRGVYSLIQYRLDAKTTGNGEDQRLEVIDWQDYTEETDEVRESFDLEPYGVRMVRLKFRGCPSLKAATPAAPARNPDQRDVTA